MEGMNDLVEVEINRLKTTELFVEACWADHDRSDISLKV